MRSIRVGVVAVWVMSAGFFSCAAHKLAPTKTDSLAAIAAEFWAERTLSDPLMATYLGDRRFDARLPDVSVAEKTRHHKVLGALKDRLTSLGPSLSSRAERISSDVLLHELNSELDADICHYDLWVVDQMSGPQVSFPELPSFHTISQAKDAETLAQRYRAMRAYYDTHMSNLKAGLSKGYVAARINVEKVVAQIDAQLKIPVEKSPYVDSVKWPETWDKKTQQNAVENLTKAVSEYVYPALAEYRHFLVKEILPRSRMQNVGVSNIPEGVACYQARVAHYTGTQKTAEQLHQLGLAEIERIQKEMQALILDSGSKQTVREYVLGLKKTPSQYLQTSAALLDYNRKLVERAQEALPRAFSLLPKTRLDLKEIESFRAKESPAGYYYNAPSDGSRPAYYYLNTWEPTSRPLYNMAALAFHEGIPGHHLQIALANENAALPEFQRQLGHTAFVEGWALYSERLAGELGLYQTLSEKIGALNYEMWRAARLVVDTGIHSKGWTREQALQFFTDNTAHTEAECVAEVERYIVWPGQALAYKVGQLEILSMREEARKALGDRFDLKAFHARLLSQGAMPPDTARRDIQAWVKESLPLP